MWQHSRFRNALWFCFLVLLVESRRRPSAATVTVDDDEDDQKRITPSSFLRDPQPVTKRATVHQNTISSKAILKHHHEYLDDMSKSFQGEVLAYVTPWNRKGYRNAKLMAPKIDWLVPVWFQIRQHDNGTVYIAGNHDVDQSWLKEMRQLTSHTCTSEVDQEETRDECVASVGATGGTRTMKIVPRIALEIDPSNLPHVDDVITKLMLPLSNAYDFEGFTLEIPIQHYSFIGQLASAMKRKGLVVVLVVPPLEIASRQGPEAQIFGELGVVVDRLSVMSYDYASRVQGFPNAPIDWVRKVMAGFSKVDSLRGKLLLGLPMYGWRGNEAMIGDNMVLWLGQQGSGQVEVTWDSTFAEHLFVDDRTKKRSSYPTLSFLMHRLRVAEELSEGVVGVALWELGQAMTYFFDCF